MTGGSRRRWSWRGERRTWWAGLADADGQPYSLQSLEKVAIESAVGDYRLDILARGVEYDGNEISVCIENQYGGTDHKHLGQLVTYLAQQGGGLAVWVVEDASAAHVATVDFLNRTSDNSVGYLLVRTRFTRGAADAYQVHFEPLARPNAFTKQPRRRRFTADDDTDGGPPRGPRQAFLDRVLPVVREPLLGAGFPNLNVHASGSYLWVRWPADTFIANLCSCSATAGFTPNGRARWLNLSVRVQSSSAITAVSTVDIRTLNVSTNIQ